MNFSLLLAVVGLTLLLPAALQGQPVSKRPEWDQQAAVEKVKSVLQREKQGQPWDKIAWLTNVEEAVARAQKEQKPLLVYLFLKKNVGPAAAPC